MLQGDNSHEAAQMKIKKWPSENPAEDQWTILNQYCYPRNIERYIRDRKGEMPAKATTEYVAGCLQQAGRFFAAVGTAPLDIAPIIGYYGASALLGGTLALLSGARPTINSHGMKLEQTPQRHRRLGQIGVVTGGSVTGALRVFAAQFSPLSPISGGQRWRLLDLLGWVPDLRDEFRLCYPTARPATLAVELVPTDDGVVERVPLEDIAAIGNPAAVLARIEGLDAFYIQPQVLASFAVLRRKVGSEGLPTYTVSGDKYFPLAHLRDGRKVTFALPIVMFMALFALGHLARYHPDRWNPFVRSDETGERLAIERFLSIASRQLPNLMLNEIVGERVEFAAHT